MALAAPTTASAGGGGGPTGARGRIDSTSSEMSADGTIMALAELVRAALGLKQSGGLSSHYDQIVQQLRASTDPLALTNLYAALTHNVSVLGATPAKFSALLDAAFMFSWAVADEGLVAAFVNFLCHMVSANSCFLVPSFRVLLRNLCPPEATTEADFKHLEARAGPIHDTLRTILRLVPTGTRSLFNVVQDRFPHRRLDLPVHTAFVTHALRIADDVPALRDRLLMLIVDRIIQIDVEIKLEDVPDSAVAGAKDHDVEQLLFPMDDAPEGDEGGAGDSGTPGAGAGVVAVGGIAATDDMAKKLDALMGILFAYVKRHMVAAMSSQLLQSNGTVVDAPPEPPAAAAQTFRSLLRTFERVVLTTHKSKYTQFLVFYGAQFHPTFPDAFVGRLIDTMRADNCPAVTRQSCAAYLGSFLARATYVDESTLKSAFCFVMEWIQHYLTAAATLARRQHATAHRVFYAICQSAFYVVCFHHRTLQHNADGTPFLAQFNWDAILLSPLLVVKHCAEAISREFLRVCRHLRLVERRVLTQCTNAKLHPLAAVTEAGDGAAGVDGAKEASGAGAGEGAGAGAGRGGVDESARAGGIGSGLNPLDSFFPFDPYLLRTSSSYINGLYRWWRGLGVDSDEEDSGSEGSDDDGGSMPSTSVASSTGGGHRPTSIGLGVANPGGAALRTPGGMRRARGFSFDIHPGVPAAESGGPSFGDADGDSLASSPALGTPLDDDLMAGHGLLWRRDRGLSSDGGGDESASFLGEGDSDMDDGTPHVMVRGRRVGGKASGSRRGRVDSGSDSDDDGAGGGRRVRGSRARVPSASGDDDDDSLANMSLGTTPVRHTGGLPGVRAGGAARDTDPGPPFVRRSRQGSTDSATFVDGWGDDDF